MRCIRLAVVPMAGIVITSLMGCPRRAVDLSDRPCDAGECLEGFVCDPDTNTCIATDSLAGAGSECFIHADCKSAYCDGRWCCASGDCCRTVADCPASYAWPPTCTDVTASTACQGSSATAGCYDNTCASDTVDDDSACDSLAHSCPNNFASIPCDARVEQPTPVCLVTCGSNADCAPGATCQGTSCEGLKGDGQACTDADECASGYCNGSFCCTGGDCCNVPGDCPSTYTEAPTCNDTSSSTDCQGTGQSATCLNNVCGSQSLDDDSDCDGLQRTCQDNLAPIDCTAAVAQPVAQCPTGCTTPTDCLPDFDCVSEQCECASVSCALGTCITVDDGSGCRLPTSCSDLLTMLSGIGSGPYVIEDPSNNQVQVYCEMSRSGGGWTRIVDFDKTTDPCPGTWQDEVTPNACSRNMGSGGTRSATFASPIGAYSEVMGYVRGYQGDSMDSFRTSGTTLGGNYVDGVSITYGTGVGRTHIWTYVVAWSDDDNAENSRCPCLGDTPARSFVGTNFYCESGATGRPNGRGWFTADVLWDGDGSGTDCDTNGDPSWFVRDLGPPITDPVEVRLIADQSSSNEDVGVYRMELYVR